MRRRIALSRESVRIDLALIALTGLAAVLTLHGLGPKSIDFDEAVSVAHARLGPTGLWSVLSGGDPNTGLYYALLDGWMRIFGDGEVAVRSLGAIAAVLAVPVVALLGIRLFGRRAGLAAGLVLALNAFFIQYAQWAPRVRARAAPRRALIPLLRRRAPAPGRANRVGYVLATRSPSMRTTSARSSCSSSS